jgi:hypothetical protein
MRGGSHDGQRIAPPTTGPRPNRPTYFSIPDGEAYARTGDHVLDDNGQAPDVYVHDPDGSLTERARRAVTRSSSQPADPTGLTRRDAHR